MKFQRRHTILILLFILACGFSLRAADHSSAPESAAPYATFKEGGRVSPADLWGFVDSRARVFASSCTVMDYADKYRDPEYLVSVVANIAFGDIASRYMDSRGVELDTIARGKLQEALRLVTYQYLLLDHVLPRLLDHKEKYETRITQYYEQHRDEEFRLPDSVGFRIIFFNLKDVTDESVIQQKKEEASRVAALLEKEPAQFDFLATENPDNKKWDVKPTTMGPYPLDRLDKALGRALADLQPGELTPVVRTKSGFIIARLEEREARYQPLEKVRGPITTKIGPMSGKSVEETWFKSLCTDFKPRMYYDRITSDTARLDVVIAESGGVTLTNREINFIFDVDADFNAIIKEKPAEDYVANQFIFPRLRQKCIALNAERRGMLANDRYRTMRRVTKALFYGEQILEYHAAGKIPLPADTAPNIDLRVWLLEKYAFTPIRTPEYTELFPAPPAE